VLDGEGGHDRGVSCAGESGNGDASPPFAPIGRDCWPGRAPRSIVGCDARVWRILVARLAICAAVIGSVE
jgi:hypothetical protein